MLEQDVGQLFLRHDRTCQPGIEFMLQCGCDFSSPVSLFEAVQVARRDTDLFGSLELRKSKLLPPGLELVSQGFRARQAALRKRLIAGQALICLANNVRWFNRHYRE